MKIRFTRFLRHFWPAISINICYPSIQSRFANSYAAQLSNDMFPVLWNLTVLEIIEFKCLKNWENAREGHLRRYGTSIPRCLNPRNVPYRQKMHEKAIWRLYAIFRALNHRLCSHSVKIQPFTICITRKPTVLWKSSRLHEQNRLLRQLKMASLAHNFCNVICIWSRRGPKQTR